MTNGYGVVYFQKDGMVVTKGKYQRQDVTRGMVQDIYSSKILWNPDTAERIFSECVIHSVNLVFSVANRGLTRPSLFGISLFLQPRSQLFLKVLQFGTTFLVQ